jgi:hypothetical protein
MTRIRGEQISYITLAEVLADPVAPHVGQTWILKTDYAGQPMGLLLSLTYNYSTYQLSYKTSSGTIIRTNLS